MQRDMAICEKCNLNSDARVLKPCIMGEYSQPQLHTINKQCDVMVVVEGPTPKDELIDMVFADPKAGKFLRDALKNGNINDYYLTPAVKCISWDAKVKEAQVKTGATKWGTREKETQSPTPVNIKSCNAYFQKELEEVNPKYVLLLGNAAMVCGVKKSGITKYHGNPFKGEGRILFPTYSAAALFHNTKYMQPFLDDLNIFANLIDAKGDTTTMKKPVDYKYVNTMAMAIEMFRELKTKKLFAFDIETPNLNPWKHTEFFKTPPMVLCISFSTTPQTAWVLPLDHPDSPFTLDERATLKAVLRNIMEDASIHKIAHNAKFDVKYIWAVLGIITKSLVFDTMLASYLLNEEGGEHGLKDLALRLTDLGSYDEALDAFRKTIKPKSEEYNYSRVPMSMLFTYAACDADATMRLYYILKEMLEKEDLLKAMALLVLISESVTHVEVNGAKINLPYGEAMAKVYYDKIETNRESMRLHADIKAIESYYALRDALQWLREKKVPKKQQSLFETVPTNILGQELDKFFALIDKADIKKRLAVFTALQVKHPELFISKGLTIFNFNSAYHLRDLIYNYYGEKVIKKTASGAPSTDEETLVGIATKYEVLQEILKHKKLVKFWSTYLAPVATEWMCEDGLIHSNYKIHGTATGRLASSSPNMQNLPRDDKVVKNMFISRFEGGYIINADYSQIELRVLAVYSGDDKLIEFYNSGKDFHSQTAATLKKKPLEEVTEEERQIFKAINFLIVYGGTARALAAKTGISEEVAQGFMNDYFKTFPGVTNYINYFRKQATDNKFIVTLTGRKRRLLNVESDKEYVREEALRMAINTPIQSTASDLTQTSMANLQRVFTKMNLKSLVIGTVHDSIMFDAHPSEIAIVYKIIKTIMENPPYDFCKNPDGSFIVPYKCDIGIGLSYGATKDLIEKDGAMFIVKKVKEVGEDGKETTKKVSIPFEEYQFKEAA